MSTRQRPIDLGTADERRIAAAIANDLRDARLAAGLSQEMVGRAAGLSASRVSRLERARTDDVSLGAICRLARVVGLAASVKLFPAGPPVRDAGQAKLLGRLAPRLGSPLRMLREVGLPIRGDLRAWDAIIEGVDRWMGVEAETVIRDGQAVDRGIALKLRDDPRVGSVLLLVNRTAHNRRVLGEIRESLRERYPLDGAAILGALGAGRLPPASGILLL